MNLRLLVLFFIIASSIVWLGCESDPLLSPMSEATEETGSYGNTNLPVNEPTQGTPEPSAQAQPRNPKRF